MVGDTFCKSRHVAEPVAALRAHVLRSVRQQGHVARALERDGQRALVLGAGAGLAARLDLGPLADVAAEAIDLLVVDGLGLVGAEGTDLAAAAVVVRGKRVAEGVEFYIAAASNEVQAESEQRRDWQALIDAGPSGKVPEWHSEQPAPCSQCTRSR